VINHRPKLTGKKLIGIPMPKELEKETDF